MFRICRVNRFYGLRLFGLIVVLLSLWLPGCRSGDINSLPVLSFQGIEPQVQSKIARLIKDVRSQPNDDQTWGRLAMNLYVHGFRIESIPCYKEAYQLNPEVVRWPYLCAIALYNLNDERCLTWYKKAVVEDGGNLLLQLRMGEALLAFDRHADAGQAFEKALALNGQSPDARLGLAKIEYAKQNFPVAIDQLKQVVKINPKQREALSLLASCYRHLNDSQNFMLMTSRMRNLPADNQLKDPFINDMTAEGVSSYWHRERGQAYLEAGGYRTAISEFKAALVVKPNAVTYNNLGIALSRMNDLDPAIDNFRKALGLKPDKIEFLNNLGATICKQGNYAEGIPYINAAFQKDPSSIDVAMVLTRQYRNTGQWREAVAVFRQGLAADPENVYYKFHLGMLLSTAPEADARNGREALALAKQLVRVSNGQSPQFLDLLALAYAENNDFNRAQQTIDEAIKLARQQGNAALIESLTAKKNRFQNKQPWRIGLKAN